jgi:AcrR family transcriptional regulator
MKGRPRATSHAAIRDVALHLFEERGYGATSLEQIAEAAGISRATLFSYFRAKRDLVWEELDHGMQEAHGALEDSRGPLVDVIVGLIVRLARFRAADREVLAARWRLVQDSDELRAHSELQTAELSRLIVQDAFRRAGDRDLTLVDHVARALMAVSVRCTEEWSEGAGPDLDLDQYTSEQLRPLAVALRPLINGAHSRVPATAR